MRRHALFLALLVSVGINCGLIGVGIARHRMRAAEAEFAEGRPLLRDGGLLADRLRLAGDAREQFLRLQRELAERVHSGRRQIDEARRELRQELVSSRPDRARVEELLTQLARAQDALDRALVANVQSARDLLDGAAEREYLRFVERFGPAMAGPRPPGPPPARWRDRLPGERLRGAGGRPPRFRAEGPGEERNPDDPEDPEGPSGEFDEPNAPPDRRPLRR